MNGNVLTAAAMRNPQVAAMIQQYLSGGTTPQITARLQSAGPRFSGGGGGGGAGPDWGELSKTAVGLGEMIAGDSAAPETSPIPTPRPERPGEPMRDYAPDPMPSATPMETRPLVALDNPSDMRTWPVAQPLPNRPAIDMPPAASGGVPPGLFSVIEDEFMGRDTVAPEFQRAPIPPRPDEPVMRSTPPGPPSDPNMIGQIIGRLMGW